MNCYKIIDYYGSLCYKISQYHGSLCYKVYGASGRLRSLHSFIDLAEHHMGIRVSSNDFSVENFKTIAGKNGKLINVPYYLVSKLDKILEANI